MDTTPDHFRNPPPRRIGALGWLERPDGRLAVIRRAYWGAISQWGLPGGSAPPNTHPRSALTLAVAAKLGLRVTPARKLASDYAPAKPGQYEGTNEIYHALLPAGAEAQLAADCGYVELRWVSVEQALELAVDHERTRIEQCAHALADGSYRELYLGLPFPHPTTSS
ncbi:NUDIX domain-containing protein [Kitasatospora sp. NPDC101155]|uniref:NUDIX domain-containing protein n=1 Tax=Kitasatospora sp. NPDC101155 TaxID=3364097 RepID=UPI0037F6CE29